MERSTPAPGAPSPRPLRGPVGFAHRGGRADAPENTLIAFERALARGAPGLESDVWVTADGHVVLDHDGIIGSRRRQRPIRTAHRDELPPHIPTLAELYERCGIDFELSVDVKDGDAAEPTAAVAAAARAADRLWLCTPSRRLLKTWRELDSRVRLVDSAPLAAFRRDPRARIAALEPIGAHALNVRRQGWSRRWVDEVHAAGRLALAWDAQRRSTLDRVLAMGVDGVFSDHVARMVAALDAR